MRGYSSIYMVTGRTQKLQINSTESEHRYPGDPPPCSQSSLTFPTLSQSLSPLTSNSFPLPHPSSSTSFPTINSLPAPSSPLPSTPFLPLPPPLPLSVTARKASGARLSGREHSARWRVTHRPHSTGSQRAALPGRGDGTSPSPPLRAL